MDMKIWICENCSIVPKKTDKILKNLLDLQQELKSLKSNVEEILKTQKINKSCDTETEKPPPANIKKTSAKSTGNNTHLPTSTFDDDCQGIHEEKDSDCESTFKIIEENLLLKRDNKELKDRLIILERVLDQVLRDQEEKRSLKLENREEFKWKKVQSRHKASERKQFSLEKSNSFDILSDLEETDNSETESTCNGASVFDYKRRRTGPRIRSKKENSQISRQSKQLKSSSLRKAHVKRTEESMFEKDRSKILIIGDSQLHHIEESRLSGKNIKALVRSKGGLKVEQVTNRYGELLNEDFDEIIIHVGVNNTEHESEESVMNKFRTLSESIKESHVAFSGILRRSDKPELNQKITCINSLLKNLCLDNGLDFIDNDNVNFKHLGRDGLHINKDGQRRLAINFINHIKSY